MTNCSPRLLTDGLRFPEGPVPLDTYRDLGGPLIEPCVRQAIQDSGVGERGIDVQVLVADHPLVSKT